MARSTTRKTVPAKGRGRVAAKRVKRILNVIPSRDTERDFRFENAVGAGLAAAAGVASSKDLRKSWWKIGDQGSTGSCVGWATADSVLRWHFVKNGEIAQTQKLSPRFIWLAAKEFDEFTTTPTVFIEAEGTSLKSALDISRKYGSVLDNVLPFATGQLYQGEARTFYALAAQLKIASYFNLGRNPTEWRRWVAQNGPILTRLDVDRTWDEADLTKGVLATYRPSTARGGHAVALVGYDASSFIVRNSWGTSWGDKGFA